MKLTEICRVLIKKGGIRGAFYYLRKEGKIETESYTEFRNSLLESDLNHVCCENWARCASRYLNGRKPHKTYTLDLEVVKQQMSNNFTQMAINLELDVASDLFASLDKMLGIRGKTVKDYEALLFPRVPLLKVELDDEIEI